MVGEELGRLVGAFTAHLLDPLGGIRVCFAACLPRNALVRDLADQCVPEGIFEPPFKRRLAVLRNKPMALERPECGLGVLQTGETLDRPTPKDPPYHRGLLDDYPVAWIEAIQARQDDRLHVIGDLRIRDATRDDPVSV